MKAIVLEAAQGLESAILKEQPKPEPSAGEVRVALKAAALNHREIWIGKGQYPGMKLPSILGADGAGIVDAAGDGVDPSIVGSSVVLYPALNWGSDHRFPSRDFCLLGMPVAGTLAEYICVPSANVFAKPDFLSFDEAAALPTAGLTAYRALATKARLQKGEKVLVTGIGGGVATFALVFAAAMGADVFVTSSSEDNIRHASELGAKGGFNYREENWGKAARAAAGGFDVVIDGAPAPSYSAYGRALNNGARVVVYGSTGGVNIPVNAPELFLRHAAILGTAMGSLDDFSAMIDFVAIHRIRPVIHDVFDIEVFDKAVAGLQGDHLGKIVVRL